MAPGKQAKACATTKLSASVATTTIGTGNKQTSIRPVNSHNGY